MDNTEVVKKSDIIFLSVKPHIMSGVLDQINGFVEPDKLFISIAAGLTVSFLENVCKLVFVVVGN